MMDTSGEHSVPLRYLIARLESNQLRVLTLAAGETLPVFDTRQAAHDFLRHGGFGGGWQVRESTAGELISLLMGQLAEVEFVALDPRSDLTVSGASPKGASQKGTTKRAFIAALMGGPLSTSAR
jgi:hypothetical protein